MKIELVENGTAPKRMTDGAAGYDVFARKVDLEYVQGFGSCYKEDGEQVHSFPLKAVSAKIYLGFKIDCNETHDSVHSEQETHDGGYIANWTAPMNFAAILLPRSGWGTKYNFRLKNTAGVIDPDYRGEVIMMAEFDECPPELIDYAYANCEGCSGSGDIDGCSYVDECERFKQPRVGQMLIVPCYVGNLKIVDELESTERGAGGFGHTGVHK